MPLVSVFRVYLVPDRLLVNDGTEVRARVLDSRRRTIVSPPLIRTVMTEFSIQKLFKNLQHAFKSLHKSSKGQTHPKILPSAELPKSCSLGTLDEHKHEVT